MEVQNEEKITDKNKIVKRYLEHRKWKDYKFVLY